MGESSTLESTTSSTTSTTTSTTTPTVILPEWTAWGTWSECSATCDRAGAMKIRSRQCALGGAIVDDDECPGSSRVLAECEDLPPCEIDCSHITCLDPRSECIIGNDGSPICVCRFPWLEDPVTNSCTRCISIRPFAWQCGAELNGMEEESAEDSSSSRTKSNILLLVFLLFRIFM